MKDRNVKQVLLLGVGEEGGCGGVVGEHTSGRGKVNAEDEGRQIWSIYIHV
jgi:hypothetical protein